MASSESFVAHVCQQLEGTGFLRSRKMFGEYMVYVNDKPVVLICDDTVYLKILPCLDDLLAGHPTGAPYQGAKPHYIIDPDETQLLCRAVSLAESVTPIPKKKPKKPS